MNAVQENDFTQALRALGKTLPRPEAILCVSAHWYGKGVQVQAGAAPKMIHDFYGFPEELYAAQYPAKGHPELAKKTADLLSPAGAKITEDWGLDHGAWSVLIHLFPKADVPVFQLSLDYAKTPQEHYDLAKLLRPLREENVMVLGSGNIVHNLRALVGDREAGIYPWALEFDESVKRALLAEDRPALIGYEKSFPGTAKQSVPTPDHYLPFLYALGAAHESELPSFPYEGFEHASISLRAVRWG